MMLRTPGGGEIPLLEAVTWERAAHQDSNAEMGAGL